MELRVEPLYKSTANLGEDPFAEQNFEGAAGYGTYNAGAILYNAFGASRG